MVPRRSDGSQCRHQPTAVILATLRTITSLWAARRAVEASQHSPYLFPRYCNDKGCKANSASAALNKWLKQTIGDGYVIHSFRHSMRDRLRAVNCLSEMIDQIGGWSKRSVGEGYGEGFTLDNIRKQMELLNSIEGEG